MNKSNDDIPTTSTDNTSNDKKQKNIGVGRFFLNRKKYESLEVEEDDNEFNISYGKLHIKIKNSSVRSSGKLLILVASFIVIGAICSTALFKTEAISTLLAIVEIATNNK